MKYKIMLVDDDKLILKALQRLLRKEGYQLITALSAEEALNYLMNDPDVHVLISDHRMPKTTGMELLIEVRRLYPSIVRILLTGHADMDTAIEGINKGRLYRFLTKPWQDAEVKEIVREAVQFWKAVAATRQVVEAVRETKKMQTQNLPPSAQKGVKVPKR